MHTKGNDKEDNKWWIRFLKGSAIGSGFVLPGVSGGTLLAVFGFYEKIIAFLANILADFKKNFLFFFTCSIWGCSSNCFVLNNVEYSFGQI